MILLPASPGIPHTETHRDTHTQSDTHGHSESHTHTHTYTDTNPYTHTDTGQRQTRGTKNNIQAFNTQKVKIHEKLEKYQEIR